MTTAAITKPLQVVLTTGPEDVERATLGLHAALAAVASGCAVTVFLTLSGTAWACAMSPCPDQGVDRLLRQLMEFGATIHCCSACALVRCDPVGAPMRPDDVPALTRPGIELVGLTTLMEQVAAGIPTVSF